MKIDIKVAGIYLKTRPRSRKEQITVVHFALIRYHAKQSSDEQNFGKDLSA